jgi:hypothetical protein
MTTLNYAFCALYTCFLALHHCSNTTYDDDATTVNLTPFLFRATRLHMYSNISSTHRDACILQYAIQTHAHSP